MHATFLLVRFRNFFSFAVHCRRNSSPHFCFLAAFFSFVFSYFVVMLLSFVFVLECYFCLPLSFLAFFAALDGTLAHSGPFIGPSPSGFVHTGRVSRAPSIWVLSFSQRFFLFLLLVSLIFGTLAFYDCSIFFLPFSSSF